MFLSRESESYLIVAVFLIKTFHIFVSITKREMHRLVHVGFFCEMDESVLNILPWGSVFLVPSVSPGFPITVFLSFVSKKMRVVVYNMPI